MVFLVPCGLGEGCCPRTHDVKCSQLSEPLEFSFGFFGETERFRPLQYFSWTSFSIENGERRISAPLLDASDIRLLWIRPRMRSAAVFTTEHLKPALDDDIFMFQLCLFKMRRFV